jgi:Ca2+:H+ antiporter
MNKSHPFGLPLWKPALYKKSRSVVRSANRALHSSPSSAPELFLNPGNILWFFLFGWWLALVIVIVAIVMSIVPFGGKHYGLVLRELAFYLLWPFGRYVERQVEIKPAHIGGVSSSSLLANQREDEETGLLRKKKKNEGLNPLKSMIRLGPAGILYYLIFWCTIGIF